MPLLIGIAPPPVVVPPAPEVPRPVPSPGVYVPTWYAPDGSVWPLNPDGSLLLTLRGVTGLGIAPRSITADPDPIGGTRVRHIQAEPRYITWPLRIRGATHMGFLDLWRSYAFAFDMTRTDGPGILRIRRPDGTEREIEAYYEAGWEMEPGQGWLEDTPVIGLYCPDPFWRDVAVLSQTLAYTTGGDDFLDPYPQLSSGAVTGELTLNNPGTVEAWPEWTVTGPMTSFTATNVTTGEEFVITYTLTAGQTLVVTTRPAAVTGPAGQNLINTVDWPGAELWRLRRGDNAVDLQLTGAAVGTLVNVSYYPRYGTS